MELKILKIGNIVKYNGIRLLVIKAVEGCRGCYFKRLASCHPETIGVCCPPWRPEAVIFRKYDMNKKENLHGRRSNKVESFNISGGCKNE